MCEIESIITTSAPALLPNCLGLNPGPDPAWMGNRPLKSGNPKVNTRTKEET